MLNVKEIRKHFLAYEAYPNLVYLDSAASALKAKEVIEVMDEYLYKSGVNVHRGVYKLSYEATMQYEEARKKVADFINAQFEEIVFTRGASSALNLVASSYGLSFLEPGDEIISSELEHHSNQMPWLNVAQKTGAKLKYVELNNEGRITVEAFKAVLSPKTKVVALTHVSNVMGYITPIKEIIELAHQVGAIVIVDGAQSVPHMAIDVKDLDCDFFAFSGHKMVGPTGVGVLYGKKELLDKMPPIEFGGDMAEEVTLSSMSFKDTPYKFETGTPMIAEVIGLGKACEFLKTIGLDKIKEHEDYLAKLAIEKLKAIPNVIVYNPTTDTGVIAFNIEGVHPHDAASVFDKNNVCLRAGHHCAELIINWLHTIGTLRVSFYMYNDENDVEKFVASVKEAADFFSMFM